MTVELPGEPEARFLVTSDCGELLGVADRVLNFALVMMPNGPIAYPGEGGKYVTATLLVLLTIVLKVYRSILILARAGLGETAMMLLRALAEGWANLGYVIEVPAERVERATRYVSHETIEHYRWAKECVERGVLLDALPDAVRIDPKVTIESLRAVLVADEARCGDAERAAKQAEGRLQAMIKTRGHWSGLNPREIFQSAQRAAGHTDSQDVPYFYLYRMPARLLHAHESEWFLREDPGGSLTADPRPSAELVPFVLHTSTALTIESFGFANTALQLSRDRSIESLHGDLMQASKRFHQRRKARGAE